jgi:hypothetical protein
MDNNFIHIRKNHKLELRGGGIIENVKKHKSTLLKIAGGVAVPATALIVNALLNGNNKVGMDNEYVNLDLLDLPDGSQSISGNLVYS